MNVETNIGRKGNARCSLRAVDLTVISGEIVDAAMKVHSALALDCSRVRMPPVLPTSFACVHSKFAFKSLSQFSTRV